MVLFRAEWLYPLSFQHNKPRQRAARVDRPRTVFVPRALMVDATSATHRLLQIDDGRREEYGREQCLGQRVPVLSHPATDRDSQMRRRIGRILFFPKYGRRASDRAASGSTSYSLPDRACEQSPFPTFLPKRYVSPATRLSPVPHSDRTK